MMNAKKHIIVAVSFLLSFSMYGKSFKIFPHEVMIKAASKKYNDLGPGDTLLLQAGDWHHLSLRDLKGSPEYPITVINDGGLVHVNSDNYYGISISNCQYIHITGTGHEDYQYGIKISQIQGGALGGNKGTSDIEIDHLEIDNVKGMGILLKTDATCDQFQRHQFIQQNTKIHHNKISNTGLEGLYVGSSNYPGRNIICDSQTVTVLDPILVKVEVHHNVLSSTGWDAIQVSSARDLDIHHNQVYHDSKLLKPNQMSGIIIGAGSTGKIRNNLIKEGNGNGINSFALGDIFIYNNIIIDPGQWQPNNLGKYGIYINDKLAEEADVTNQVNNNLVINAPCEAIHLQTKVWKDYSTQILNNILINPGCYEKYLPHNKHESSYISYSKNKASVSNNFLHLEIDSLLLDTTHTIEYYPLKDSPVVDKGMSPIQSIILVDYNDSPRVSGSSIDIGPIEYQYPIKDDEKGQFLVINPIQNHQLEIIVKKNKYPKKLILTDIQGREVFSTELNEQNKIDLPRNLKFGIYFLTFTSGAQKENYQILIL